MSLSNAVKFLDSFNSVSVEPSEYTWGQPTVQQQQQLYGQFMQLWAMCCLPGMQFAHMSAFQQAQAQRTMFPGFMPAFPGFASPPCPSQSPSPAPSAAAPQTSAGSQQPPKASGGRPEQANKNKKAGSKAKPARGSSKASQSNNTEPAPPAGAPKLEDIDFDEDLCRLLEDDKALLDLQDDVISEGSNGSTATSDAPNLPKNASHGSLCGSGMTHSQEQPGSLFAATNNFASAFDLDMDDAAVPAAPAEGDSWAGPAPTQSGDLNNLVSASSAGPSPAPPASSSSPARPTRASRTAAREAAAKDRDGAAPVTKITLRVKGAGVQKVSVPKAALKMPQAAPDTAQPGAGGGAEEQPLTAADLSRLLGEDDNRIPDGWDLDLDFENPFSCSISAF